MRRPARHRFLAAFLAPACLLAGGEGLGQEKDKADVARSTYTVPHDFTMRARVTAATPSEPVHLRWRYGGEGLGGGVTTGTFAENLPVGTWSPPVPLTSIAAKFPKKLFLTVTLDRPRGGDGRASHRNVRVEFEFRWRDRAVKSFEEAAPDGATVGLFIPAYRLAGGKAPDHPDFTGELGGLLAYARARAERLEKLPWSGRPVPRLYTVITDLGGHGEGAGYGIRHANRAVTEAECRSLRQLGVNALRARPAFLESMISEKTGYGAAFGRGAITGHAGFPVVRYRKGSAPAPGAGCPFSPAVGQAAQAQIAEALGHLKGPEDEVWLLTVDEIGTIFHETPEGKGKHAGACPNCTRAFQEWLKGQGLKPSDFGKGEWSEVVPADLAAPGREASGGPPDPKAALNAYYASLFLNTATAKLFTPLRDAIAQANERKRKALAGGDPKGPEARQPWLFSYALRGNNFLMQGSSLDFFEFYRHADNAFVYETSNRDPRIWGWDSYLCDVARVVSADQGIRFGIYVKPHRGAPIQRMLAAASRSARMIYWYTYGPDYHKGDSFSERPECLDAVSRGIRLLGRAEETLYGSSWARPAEVAIVNPQSSERWIGLFGPSPAKEAAWENAKWIYTALQHAHVPVDPLDEVMLAARDLSRYKVLYINGPHLTRAAAEKVASWVRAGGTLYTSGGGLAYDEAHRPLQPMEPVLGLRAREAPRMTCRVSLYGGTSIESYDDSRRVLAPAPPGAGIVAGGPFTGSFPLAVGRETLKPSTAQVLAKFADGEAAVTRNAFGQGQAYVVGFFPGLEYSALVRAESFDMSGGFPAERRSYVVAPALERVVPVVDASHHAVEGVLLRNDASGRLAVTLANWAYRRTNGTPSPEVVPLAGLRITIRGADNATKAASAALDRPLVLEKSGGAVIVVLPSLAEGDVLLLE